MAGTWQPVAFRGINTPDGSDQSLTCHQNDNDGTWVVFGWTGQQGSRPRLTRLWLGVGDPPNLDTFEPWDNDPTQWISTAVLRSLNVTDAASQQVTLQRESTGHHKPALLFNGVHRDRLDTDMAKKLGFRSVADLRAAVDRLEAAYLYVERINLGDTKPAVAIADQLHIPVQTVRVRLQRARTDGYLTSGEKGWAAGEVTQEAKTLNWAITSAVHERTGDWLTDAEREQIYQEMLEDEQQQRDLDSYLDK